MSTTANAVAVNTRSFEFAHGSKPRGEGTWAFTFGAETVFFNGAFAAAKKSAQRAASAAGFREVRVGA